MLYVFAGRNVLGIHTAEPRVGVEEHKTVILIVDPNGMLADPGRECMARRKDCSLIAVWYLFKVEKVHCRPRPKTGALTNTENKRLRLRLDGGALEGHFLVTLFGVIL